jgi:tRNA nucleotidyltransferase/poly(A) polymerase
MNYDSLKADIPLPQAVYDLSELFADASLFAVGGVVRDFLYSKFHGGDFNPKDVDLATEAPPQKVLEILNSPKAKSLGIKAFPKGESFGVISALMGDKEYEIATFREEWYDPESGDGRRPDQISFSTPEKDAQRRDLTMNALFYHLHEREVRDYNLTPQGLGQGLDDLKNLIVRPVGVARDRFREDKLRIPRLIRFFHRFGDGDIVGKLDNDTLLAIFEFKDLKGVSPERIANEFMTGLQKAKNPASYIKSYETLNLVPAVFGIPYLQIPAAKPFWAADQIGACRNLKAVLAWLLRDTKNIRKHLNNLKYPNDVSDRADFLAKLLRLSGDNVVGLLKKRDLYKQLEDEESRQAAWIELQQDVKDFAGIVGYLKVDYFLSYQTIARSQDFMHLSGPEIGKAMNELESQSYLDGLLEEFL